MEHAAAAAPPYVIDESGTRRGGAGDEFSNRASSLRGYADSSYRRRPSPGDSPLRSARIPPSSFVVVETRRVSLLLVRIDERGKTTYTHTYTYTHTRARDSLVLSRAIAAPAIRRIVSSRTVRPSVRSFVLRRRRDDDSRDSLRATRFPQRSSRSFRSSPPRCYARVKNQLDAKPRRWVSVRWRARVNPGRGRMRAKKTAPRAIATNNPPPARSRNSSAPTSRATRAPRRRFAELPRAASRGRKIRETFVRITCSLVALPAWCVRQAGGEKSALGDRSAFSPRRLRASASERRRKYAHTHTHRYFLTRSIICYYAHLGIHREKPVRNRAREGARGRNSRERGRKRETESESRHASGQPRRERRERRELTELSYEGPPASQPSSRVSLDVPPPLPLSLVLFRRRSSTETDASRYLSRAAGRGFSRVRRAFSENNAPYRAVSESLCIFRWFRVVWKNVSA